MRAIPTPSPVRNGKRRLLNSCAITAGMMALACGGPALAQVAGAPLNPPGGVTISTDTVGHSTTVGVTGAQTIINWVPTDALPTGGDIDFLPAGSSWNFNGNGSSDYVVLNRFVNGAGGSLSRQIALNGTINSTDFAVSGTQAGSIWFYNAGGILIGSTGVINVGSLVLTTNDIVTTGPGGLIDPATGIRFRAETPGSTAGVTVSNGARITASGSLAGSSYVALVAPRVTQAGRIDVNGSAAYVAAEEANIRINAGLFDINVTTGTTGGQAITHTGITTGPEQQATGQAQRIYMVAIPKNLAVSMLVSGIVGYQDATSATVKGDGSIVLSAGYNVANGTIANTPVNGTAANITVNDTIFSSDVTAHASGNFLGQPLLDIPPPAPPTSLPPPNPSGRIVALGDANFMGDTSATLAINTGRLVAVGGNLIVQSPGTATTPGNAAINVNGGGLLVQGITSVLAPGFYGTATGDTQGGIAAINVNGGGQFVATGGVNVSADAFGGVDGTGKATGDGRGGSATITVSGATPAGVASSLSGGAMNVHANGYGALPSSGPDIADTGGAGFGGSAAIRVQNGGSLSTTAGVTVEANGQGGFGLVQSGNGTGGTAEIEAAGTSATLQAGTVAINATGIGGGDLAVDPTLGARPSQNGGDGTGGTATLRFSATGTSTISLGDTTLDVSGTGGDSGEFFTPAGENATGGNARGGNATVTKSGANTAQLASLRVDASAESGAAYSGSGFTGFTGDAQGGTIDVSSAGAGSVLNLAGGSIILGASGTASSAGRENAGSGTGGSIAVSATNGGSLTGIGILAADAFGGSSNITALFSAGSGTGGSIDILADTGGTISAGAYQARADADVVNTNGNNGDAQGGRISMIARGGGGIATTSDGVTILDAGATNGVSADGSAATGGDIQLIADGGSIRLANTDFDASATSGSNDAGSASLATGGTITVRTGLDADSLISATGLDIDANGRTGANYDGFVETAGDARGGTIIVDVQGGSLQATGSGINLSATGNGGSGGEGRGGTITFTQTGGDVEVGNVTIRADGQGGRSGDGFGGISQLSLSGGSFTADVVMVSAAGNGGQGIDGNDDPDFGNGAGDGGIGQGGTATIDIDGTAVVDTNVLGAYASGTGGRGGDFQIYDFSGTSVGTPGSGGAGTGGTATINLVSGSLTADLVVADGGGFGGNGGSIYNSFSGGPSVGLGVGGNGGDGEGGEATLNLGGTTLTLGEGSLNSRAIGRGGTGGYGTDGGNGGNGTGGLAQAIVDNHDAGELALVLDSTASGGTGGTGGNGNGGNGGFGEGGVSRVEANGANAAAIVSQANFLTDGTGGAGGSAFTDFSATPAVGGRGGDGGGGYGGTVEIVASDGATITLGSTGDIMLRSMGTGGAGGSGADNPNTIPGAGPDGTDQGLLGGNGGFGGSGVGGTVHLLANGGTITSAGAPVTVTVSGLSGTGGVGGTGSGGNGAAGATLIDQGGHVVFEALATPGGPGRITLGDTTIRANGGLAGRIEMRTDGLVSMDSLYAEALGFADPTNNDTDVAPAGIFLAATGGSITTAGDMTLRSDSSIGAYAQADGQVSAGGNLTIEAGDQVDLRHEYRGEAANPTLFATGDLSISARTGISGGPGTLLGAGDTLTLQTTSVNGNIGVDRLDGRNIVITTAGFASIEHAEADENFLANVGSFRTGLNSLITGGDIDINSVGAVDLGNSTAGGHIQVGGSSIAFAALDAGAYVQLDTTGTSGTPGAITGTSIVAGAGTFLAGSSIDIGSIISDGSLFATATTGAVAIDNAEIQGNISIVAMGDITGAYSGGGDAVLSSGGNVIASVNAAGGFPDSSNPDLPSGGNVYIDAAGDVTLTDSSAAGMFGVNGQSVALTNASAGEDMLVLAQGTASLTGITVGDDLDVRAAGAITANNVSATGLGPDGFALFYSSTGGFTIGQGEGQSALDGADIDLQSSGASINATNLSAGDDIFLNAATTIALDGATTLGLGVTGGDSSIRTTGGDTTLSGLNAFSDAVVSANGTANVTGTIRAGNDVVINANAVTLADIPSSGDPIDTIAAGRDIAITTAADISGGGTLNAGRSLVLDAGGAIAITGGESGDDGEIILTGATGIDAGQLYSRGATTLTADNGDIHVGSLSSLGDVSVAANSLDIGTNGPVTFANIVTDVGDATIRSGNRLIVTNATIAGTARFDNSGEHMIIRDLTAAAAEFNANEMITMTNVSVTNSLDANAGTTIAIDGVVTGRDISLASGDIDIMSTGRVGTAGVTQGLTLANNDDEQQTFVGGTGTKNGYHVDADELTRLFGTDILIIAPEVNTAGIDSVGSAAPPDVIVDSFTMTGGASGSNLGANGSLTISTPGKMRVIGNVQLTGLSNDNGLNLIAQDALEVILGQGTVRLLGANNAPGGRLFMSSDDIIVATAAAIADVGNATTTDAINTRLGQNDGVMLDEGALFARGMLFSVNRGLYVQNSGAGTDFGQRRGLTFGDGGLGIAPGGSPRVVINGVQLGPNGQITGLDVIPVLSIAPNSAGVPGTLDPRSTFNGCLIANTGSCTMVSFEPTNLFPVQDVVEDESDSDGDSGDGTSLPTALITMRDLDPMTGEPLLDDPVTGAGNDDLWTPTTDTQQP